MAPTIFTEKDFFRILSDINRHGHVLLDRIREWNWFTLVYDNSEYEAYYCPELVKIFYSSIDQTTIDLENNKLIVHLETGDIVVTTDMIEDSTHKSPATHIIASTFLW